MISVIQDDNSKNVVFHLDLEGVDLLVRRLLHLKEEGDHVHIYATNDSDGLSMKSPYGEKAVFGKVILNLLPSEAWDVMPD